VREFTFYSISPFKFDNDTDEWRLAGSAEIGRIMCRFYHDDSLDIDFGTADLQSGHKAEKELKKFLKKHAGIFSFSRLRKSVGCSNCSGEGYYSNADARARARLVQTLEEKLGFEVISTTVVGTQLKKSDCIMIFKKRVD
jgi:hypothetical protein